MTCTPPVISSGTFCDALESELSGVSHILQIVMLGHIQEGPSFILPEGHSLDTGYTAEERSQIAYNDILLANGYDAFTLPCIIEKNPLSLTGAKGTSEAGLEVYLQNTTHNRGVVQQLRLYRFLAVAKDLATGEQLLIGQFTGDPQHAARLLPDSINGQWGAGFSDDRFLSIKIGCRLPGKQTPISTFLGGIYNFTQYPTHAVYAPYVQGSAVQAMDKRFTLEEVNAVKKVKIRRSINPEFSDVSFGVLIGKGIFAGSSVYPSQYRAAELEYGAFFGDVNAPSDPLFTLYFTYTSGFRLSDSGVSPWTGLPDIIIENGDFVRIYT